jgi:hypothetical protein
VKIEKVSREYLDREVGPGTGGFVGQSETGEPVIYILPKASTGDKLHEVFHAGHWPQPYSTPDEIAFEELSAQHFASLKMGKSGLSWNKLRGPIMQLAKEGYRTNQIYSSILKGLTKLGYELSEVRRKKLWSYAMDAYKGHRLGEGYSLPYDYQENSL